MTVVVLQIMKGQEETYTELNYTQFSEQLNARNILEVTVVAGQAVEGELTSLSPGSRAPGWAGNAAG